MRMLRHLLIAAAVLLLGTVPALAQRVIDTSTLGANVDNDDTIIQVTATDDFAVGDLCFVDRELMRITANDTTVDDLTVQRGVGGTAAAAHDNAERIWCTAGGDYRTVDPDYGQDCNRGSGQAAILPWINTRTGNIWNCELGSNRLWNGTNTMRLTYDSIQTGSP